MEQFDHREIARLFHVSNRMLPSDNANVDFWNAIARWTMKENEWTKDELMSQCDINPKLFNSQIKAFEKAHPSLKDLNDRIADLKTQLGKAEKAYIRAMKNLVD